MCDKVNTHPDNIGTVSRARTVPIGYSIHPLITQVTTCLPSMHRHLLKCCRDCYDLLGHSVMIQSGTVSSRPQLLALSPCTLLHHLRRTGAPQAYQMGCTLNMHASYESTTYCTQGTALLQNESTVAAQQNRISWQQCMCLEGTYTVACTLLNTKHQYLSISQQQLIMTQRRSRHGQ